MHASLKTLSDSNHRSMTKPVKMRPDAAKDVMLAAILGLSATEMQGVRWSPYLSQSRLNRCAFDEASVAHETVNCILV